MINKQQSKQALNWLSGSHFVNDIYTGMLNPLMPFIADKLNFSLAIATLIISISHIFSSVLQPIIGFFADNTKHRIFIFWGLIMSSIFISFSAGANTKIIFVLFVVLGSLGSSFFHPQALGLLSKLAEINNLDTAKLMGIFMGLGSLGFALGPLISSSIAHFWGLNKIAFGCVLGIIWALLMFKFVPKINSFDNFRSKLSFCETFYNILSNRNLNILFFIAMVKTLVINSCTIILPFLWKNMGYDKLNIGIALFGFIFAGGIASVVSPWLENKIGTKAVLYFSLISTFPLLIIFVLTYKTTPVIAITAFILTGAFTMLASPVIMLLAQRLAPDYRSIIAGFINGFAWGIIAILMTGLGVIAEKIGIINLLLWISFVPVLSVVSIRYINTEINR